eukprot:gene14702-20742_t
MAWNESRETWDPENMTSGSPRTSLGPMRFATPSTSGTIDSETLTKLMLLLKAVTNKDKLRLDPTLNGCIMEILRHGGAGYVEAAADMLWTLLDADHCQTRILAVQLSDKIFCCSPAFRRWLCGRLSKFLEITVGYKKERPLPGPLAAAEELRRSTISTLVTGCRHLTALGLTLPDSDLPSDEATVRQRRTQELLRARFQVLPEQVQELTRAVDAILIQLEECLSILDEVNKPSDANRAGARQGDSAKPPSSETTAAEANTGANMAVEDEDIEWEDVIMSSNYSSLLDKLNAPDHESAPRPGGLQGYAPIPSSANTSSQGAGAAQEGAVTAQGPEGPTDAVVQNMSSLLDQLNAPDHESAPIPGGLQGYAPMPSSATTGSQGASAAQQGAVTAQGPEGPTNAVVQNMRSGWCLANTSSQGVGAAQEGAVTAQGPEGPTDAVVQNMRDLYKQLSSSHLPKLQDWLRLLARLDTDAVAGPPSAAAPQADNQLDGLSAKRDRMLRSVLSIKNRVQETLSRVEASLAKDSAPVATSSQLRAAGGRGGRAERAARTKNLLSSAREQASQHNARVIFEASDERVAKSILEEEAQADAQKQQTSRVSERAESMKLSLGLKGKQ